MSYTKKTTIVITIRNHTCRRHRQMKTYYKKTNPIYRFIHFECYLYYETSHASAFVLSNYNHLTMYHINAFRHWWLMFKFHRIANNNTKHNIISNVNKWDRVRVHLLIIIGLYKNLAFFKIELKQIMFKLNHNLQIRQYIKQVS